MNDIYKKDSLKIARCAKEVIDFNTKKSSTYNKTTLLQFPFASIRFNDVRFDTSYFGVVSSSKVNANINYFKKINFVNNTSTALDNYFNNTAKYSFTARSEQVLCFVKHLRFSQVDSVSGDGNKRQLYNRLTLEIEAFINRNNSFYPAYRIDTTATAFAEGNKSLNILINVLDRFAEKLAALIPATLVNKQSYTLVNLQKRYLQRVNKPIIQNTSLKKGVYKTKNEFLNNNPSINDYEFRKDKKTNILYTKNENNEWLPIRNAFGFCDGSIIWININAVFHPLIKQGNTFELIADANLIREKVNKRVFYIQGHMGLSIGLNTISLLANYSDRYYMGKSVFQLNLDDGEFY